MTEEEMTKAIAEIQRKEPVGRDPILAEREYTHGNYKATAQIAQVMKRVVRHYRPDLGDDQMESLEMICTKMARILAGDPNEPDHWIDGAGYFKLGAEGCAKKDRA